MAFLAPPLRRPALVGLVLGTLCCLLVVGRAPVAIAASGDVVVIEGRGFGHGVGMSQDGAFWMGIAGRTSTDILRTYYPGTALGKRTGRIRIPLKASVARIELPDGARVGSTDLPPGTVLTATLTGNQIVVRKVPGAIAVHPTSTTKPVPRTSAKADALPDASTRGGAGPGRFAVVPEETVPLPTETGISSPGGGAPETTPVFGTDPSAPLLPSESGSPEIVGDRTKPAAITTTTIDTAVARGPFLLIDAGHKIFSVGDKRYRGALDLRVDKGLSVANDLDVEDYLRGMGEITFPHWPAAALEAQSIAARTYALREMSESGAVCSTQTCQVYVGVDVEFPEMDRAVTKTAGQVVLWEGSLAKTLYSASDGGFSATPEEGFGGGPDVNAKYPYLLARPSLTGDVRAWEVRVPLVDLGKRFGYPGVLDDVVVYKTGPSGRVLQVALVGDKGTRLVDGIEFKKSLGMRSGLFSIRFENPAVPTAAPAAAALSQGALGSLPPFAEIASDAAIDSSEVSAKTDVGATAGPSPDADTTRTSTTVIFGPPLNAVGTTRGGLVASEPTAARASADSTIDTTATTATTVTTATTAVPEAAAIAAPPTSAAAVAALGTDQQKTPWPVADIILGGTGLASVGGVTWIAMRSKRRRGRKRAGRSGKIPPSVRY